MDGIVFLIFAILLGSFLSSVAFGFIARGLGYVSSETMKPAYRTAADFRVLDNFQEVLTGLKARRRESFAVYYSYDPFTSQYYSILPKGDSPGLTKFQHQLKTRYGLIAQELPTQNAAGRERNLQPAGDRLRRIDLDEKDGGSFAGGFADAGDE